MVPLRCLHPPGGAMALYVVLTSGDGWHLAAFPVLFNVVLLLIAAVVYNGLTGRRYPHPSVAPKAAASQGASPHRTWMRRWLITTRCST